MWIIEHCQQADGDAHFPLSFDIWCQVLYFREDFLLFVVRGECIVDVVVFVETFPPLLKLRHFCHTFWRENGARLALRCIMYPQYQYYSAVALLRVGCTAKV
jgi:hypothetical protein